jgi:hypothetical protein
VTGQDPIFCGRCGTPNPGGNLYCRKCGHRLADDVVEAEAPPRVEPPRSPVSGISLERFPLVDPESGEEISPPADLDAGRAPGAQVDASPPARRGSVIARSLAIHFVVTSVLGLATLVVLSRFEPAASLDNAMDFYARFSDITERSGNRQLDQDQAQVELRELFESHGIIRVMLIVSGPVLLGFFIGGFIAGRLWRARPVIDVALSALLLGGLCSLCLCNLLVLPLAFMFSMLGAMVGRRQR